MAEGVLALQAAEVIGGSTFWKAIGVAGAVHRVPLMDAF
jgi:hypothetical protein